MGICQSLIIIYPQRPQHSCCHPDLALELTLRTSKPSRKFLPIQSHCLKFYTSKTGKPSCFAACSNITVLPYLTSVHCPSLSPPSQSDAYQVLNVFYKLSSHIHHCGAPHGFLPGLPPSSHTQTPPVTLEPSFCHIPPMFMRLQALHYVEHVGHGGPSAIPTEHMGHGGTLCDPHRARGTWRILCDPLEHMGHGGPSVIPRSMWDTEDPLRSRRSTWDTEDPLRPPRARGTWRTLCDPQASPLVSSLTSPRHELSAAAGSLTDT